MISYNADTVFVSGFFNILHPGHVRLLRFASELGERLVVGVLPDSLAGDAVTVGELSRLEAIRSLRMVDESFIIEHSVIETIEDLRPDIVVKGREHVNQQNEELRVLETYGGRLVFSSGDSFFSSTDLIRSELEIPERLPIDLPLGLMDHHGITHERLREILSKLSKVRVLVVGDSIVDEYISCHPLGMSREDPTLVVTPIETKAFVGGAAIIAAHAASVAGSASLHTVTGADSQADFLNHELINYGVETRFYTDDGRPTTTKQRWRAGGKTLLRVSHLHQDPIAPTLQQVLYEGVASVIDKFDVIIFSDFNYGVLPQPLVDRLTDLGCKNGQIMAADSQASSQIGDVSRFQGMHLITPTEYEARVAARNFGDGLVVLADQLRGQSEAEIVMLTLGEDGLFIRGPLGDRSLATAQLPSLNRSPVDVAGAGDSLLTIASMALAAGANMLEAGLLGSLAAAVQVSTMGNRPVSIEILVGLVSK